MERTVFDEPIEDIEIMGDKEIRNKSKDEIDRNLLLMFKTFTKRTIKIRVLTDSIKSIEGKIGVPYDDDQDLSNNINIITNGINESCTTEMQVSRVLNVKKLNGFYRGSDLEIKDNSIMENRLLEIKQMTSARGKIPTLANTTCDIRLSTQKGGKRNIGRRDKNRKEKIAEQDRIMRDSLEKNRGGYPLVDISNPPFKDIFIIHSDAFLCVYHIDEDGNRYTKYNYSRKFIEENFVQDDKWIYRHLLKEGETDNVNYLERMLRVCRYKDAYFHEFVLDQSKRYGLKGNYEYALKHKLEWMLI
jgi:hypothetical protein